MGRSSTIDPSTGPSKKPSSAVRNVGIDLLRIVSIAAVVLGHAFETGVPGGGYLEMWRMPLFFFLTGYFWSAGRPFRRELSSRWKSLGIPYLAWAVIISIWVVVVAIGQGNFGELGPTLANGWYGGSDQKPPWWAFWFISVLFFTTILRRWLERFPVWAAWGVSLVGLGLALIPDSALGRTPLGIGLALPCLFFVLSGELFRYGIEPRITRYKALTGLFCVAVGMFAVYAGVARPNIKFVGFGDFLITPVVGVVMAAGLVMIFGTLVERWSRGLRNPVNAIVRTGTVVVLFHGWVLGALPSPEITGSDIINDILQWLMVLVVSWGVGLWINATRFSPLLAGVPVSLREPKLSIEPSKTNR